MSLTPTLLFTGFPLGPAVLVIPIVKMLCIFINYHTEVQTG